MSTIIIINNNYNHETLAKVGNVLNYTVVASNWNLTSSGAEEKDNSIIILSLFACFRNHHIICIFWLLWSASS